MLKWVSVDEMINEQCYQGSACSNIAESVRIRRVGNGLREFGSLPGYAILHARVEPGPGYDRDIEERRGFQISLSP